MVSQLYNLILYPWLYKTSKTGPQNFQNKKKNSESVSFLKLYLNPKS